MLILIALCVFITVSSLVLSLGQSRLATDPEERLQKHQSRSLSDLERQTQPAFSFGEADNQVPKHLPFETIAKELSTWVSSKFSSSYLQEIEKQLVMAGLQQKIKPAQFVVMRMAFTCLLPLVIWILWQGKAPLLTLIELTAFGWVAPGFWLKRQVSRRQNLILKALPDTIDLLTVSVEAGLAFDAACSRISERTVGPLRDEFRHYLRLVRMGTPRRDAMRELGERSGVTDLHAFTTGIIQADQLGVSMSKVLRVQSEDLRRKRRQRAEEKAMKAPIKMLIPLVFCIFPSIFIVLLGPAGINIVSVFSKMN